MTRLLLELTLKLNSNFLASGGLSDILHAILVGITAGEGLGFNRAIFFEYDSDSNILRGNMAVGPADMHEADTIWNNIAGMHLSIFDILESVRKEPKTSLYNIIKGLEIPLTQAGTPLEQAITRKKAVRIIPDKCYSCNNECFCKEIGSNECVVVPLHAHNEIYGLIFADNFVTGRPISSDETDALHLFAGLGAMAIYQVRMHQVMQKRLTYMERLNEELEANRDRLVASERYASLGRMSDQLLHEIRNPFAVIGGTAKLLERKNRDPELDKYISTIVHHSKRIEQSLNNLAEFTTLPELIKEPVNLAMLVRSSIELLSSEMERHHIAWHLILPRPEPVLNLDKNHFQQAILHVMRNSIEAMADGGMLIVAMEYNSDDGFHEIRLTDTGLGIAKGHIRKADEPFFTTKTHSMGLGLSLAKRTLEMHNGRLMMTRNRIGGTTTIFQVPHQV